MLRFSAMRSAAEVAEKYEARVLLRQAPHQLVVELLLAAGPERRAHAVGHDAEDASAGETVGVVVGDYPYPAAFLDVPVEQLYGWLERRKESVLV